MNVHIAQDNTTGEILGAWTGDTKGAELANMAFEDCIDVSIYLVRVYGA